MGLPLDFMKKDGGYSWLVLLAIVVNNFCCMGYLFTSTGIYGNIYPELLDQERSQTNAIGSTLIGVFLFTVPINTVLLPIIGCRALSAIGFILTITGAISSAFGTQIWHLIVGYSIVGGLGMSMNMTSSIGIVPHYFEKKKAAAYSCTGLGQGISMVVFPYILTTMLDTYGYKLTLLYISPIFLLSVTAPIVFKPQISPLKPESARQLFTSYLSIFKRYITPFYFLNSYCWNGGQVGVIVLLFGYISGKAGLSVAVASQSIMGGGFLAGTFILVLYLLRFTLNHLLLHLFCNIFLGVSCVMMASIDLPIVFYVFAGLFGVVYGITIANMACVSSHLYTNSEVEYAFGANEAVGGIAGFIAPLTAGIIQTRYGSDIGMYYLGSHGFLGAIILLAAALIRKDVWKSLSVTHEKSTSETDIKASDNHSNIEIGNNNNVFVVEGTEKQLPEFAPVH